MNQKVIKIQASDKHDIFLRCWSPVEREPVLSVHLLHGMSEHSGRYEYLAKKLVEKGAAVYAHDHRGHGESSAIKDLGHFGDKDGWKLVIDDVKTVNKYIADKRSLPIVLIGHSMGSFIALQYGILYGSTLAKLVLSAPTWVPGFMIRAGRFIPALETLRQGSRGKSLLVHAATFGSYNRGFKPLKTSFDWLSRDPDQVAKYINDPKCGFLCTNRLWLDLLGGFAQIFNVISYKNIPSLLPIYILGGDKDPISRGGALKKLETHLLEGGVKDVSCTIYKDCRHEVFNEINRDEIIEDMTQWIFQSP